MIEPESLMRLALDKAREGVAAGQTPFGCAISRGDDVLAVAHNTVLADPDITAHAEMNALRQACRKIGGVHLTGAVVATTCEPCPMCMAALHWARVEKVFYGATIADASAAGFNELNIAASDVVRLGGGQVMLICGVLETECRELFRQWSGQPHRQAY